jgi:hypothetical protein
MSCHLAPDRAGREPFAVPLHQMLGDLDEHDSESAGDEKHLLGVCLDSAGAQPGSACLLNTVPSLIRCSLGYLEDI